MKSLCYVIVTFSVTLCLLVSGTDARASDTFKTASQPAVSKTEHEIEVLMTRLRRMPKLPEIVLNLAEKAYRFYKLHRIEKKVTALQKTTIKVLVYAEAMAARVARQEILREADLAKFAEHDKALGKFEADIKAARDTAARALTGVDDARRELADLKSQLHKMRARKVCKIPMHVNRNGVCINISTLK